MAATSHHPEASIYTKPLTGRTLRKEHVFAGELRRANAYFYSQRVTDLDTMAGLITMTKFVGTISLGLLTVSTHLFFVIMASEPVSHQDSQKPF